MRRYRFIIFFSILFKSNCVAQRGGVPTYPVLSKEKAKEMGYVFVSNTNDLLKEIRKDGNKIFIAGSFELMERANITGKNVTIESDKNHVITSNLWFTKFRFYESFTITGKNVTIKGLVLKGSDCDIRTLDYKFAQTAIRCHADSFHIENCSITCFGWAALYMHRYQGALIEQCYLASNKNAGYGYGVWFEGKPGNVGVVRNCLFEDNRETVDAGGQLGAWSVIGCVIDNSLQSHKNPDLKAGIGESIIGNYFIEKKAGWQLPVPAVDTGWIVVKDNYFAGDSTVGRISSTDQCATISVLNNHYNSNEMKRPVCSLSVDSNKMDRYFFNYSSPTSSYYEMYWGDGSMPVMNEKLRVHEYLVPGTYTPKLRVFNADGIPSVTVQTKIVHGNGINAAIKSTARQHPAAGFYKVQLLIDEIVVLEFDASEVWKWKRINHNASLSGKHKIAIRLKCIQDCSNAIQLWIDDFDYSGTISNSGFEDERDYHNPPYSNWKQKSSSNIPVGAGITHLEKCGGNYAWRFEFRPKGKIVNAGSYAELNQVINF